MTNEELFNALMKEITEIKQDITEINQDITNINQDITEINQDIKNINLKMENEIKEDIQLLVEGHKTLVENLERNSKASATIELNEYRIKLLERDINKLKKEYNMN